jgi:hypothetical protein
MSWPTWIRAAGVATLVLGAASCGSDEASTTPPTADELATTLVVEDSFDGDWTLNTGPDDSTDMSSGVVPDELQEQLPRIEFCESASDESRAAAEDLQWQAFRQLDLTVEDPIDPPDREGHMVAVQQFLTAGDPAEIEATFDLLQEGMEACLGDFPAGEEGPGTAEEMTLPDVGDDRYGVLLTFDEAGGWAEWRLHTALVRQGPVLMSLQVMDIRAGEGVEPYYSIDDVGTMVQTAVDRL